MAEQQSMLSRHDLEAKLVKRCWENQEFRKEFVADPAGAFVRYLQVPETGLPKIVIHQESSGSWHIVVPAKPAYADELSEHDLEGIAGGNTPKISASAGAASGLITGVLSLVTMSGAAGMSATLKSGW